MLLNLRGSLIDELLQLLLAVASLTLSVRGVATFDLHDLPQQSVPVIGVQLFAPVSSRDAASGAQSPVASWNAMLSTPREGNPSANFHRDRTHFRTPTNNVRRQKSAFRT